MTETSDPVPHVLHAKVLAMHYPCVEMKLCMCMCSGSCLPVEQPLCVKESSPLKDHGRHFYRELHSLVLIHLDLESDIWCILIPRRAITHDDMSLLKTILNWNSSSI